MTKKRAKTVIIYDDLNECVTFDEDAHKELERVGIKTLGDWIDYAVEKNIYPEKVKKYIIHDSVRGDILFKKRKDGTITKTRINNGNNKKGT